MANGMPTWEEWNGLTEEQRQYQLFKVLADLYQRDCKYEIRLDALENRKVLDKGISGVAGLIGGYFAIISKWFIDKL